MAHDCKAIPTVDSWYSLSADLRGELSGQEDDADEETGWALTYSEEESYRTLRTLNSALCRALGESSLAPGRHRPEPDHDSGQVVSLSRKVMQGLVLDEKGAKKPYHFSGAGWLLTAPEGEQPDGKAIQEANALLAMVRKALGV